MIVEVQNHARSGFLAVGSEDAGSIGRARVTVCGVLVRAFMLACKRRSLQEESVMLGSRAPLLIEGSKMRADRGARGCVVAPGLTRWRRALATAPFRIRGGGGNIKKRERGGVEMLAPGSQQGYRLDGDTLDVKTRK